MLDHVSISSSEVFQGASYYPFRYDHSSIVIFMLNWWIGHHFLYYVSRLDSRYDERFGEPSWLGHGRRDPGMDSKESRVLKPFVGIVLHGGNVSLRLEIPRMSSVSLAESFRIIEWAVLI